MKLRAIIILLGDSMRRKLRRVGEIAGVSGELKGTVGSEGGLEEARGDEVGVVLEESCSSIIGRERGFGGRERDLRGGEEALFELD